MTFGSRTKAEEALRGADLTGKTVIVTGANSGIGAETARVLAHAGAAVTMACRTVQTGEEAAAKFRAAKASTLKVAALDLTDLDSVRRFASAFLAEHDTIDLLVNNAGIMASPLGATKQGIESQIGTNHVGHFLLTKLLLSALERSKAARIVNVSSALHTRGRGERMLETLTTDKAYATRTYAPFDAYGDSKLANVLFTRALAKRLPKHVEAFSLHPGVIATNLTRSMGVVGAIYKTVAAPFLKSIPQGAATSVYAAVAPELEGRSGAYLADCQVKEASREGRSDDLAARLWDASEMLVA